MMTEYDYTPVPASFKRRYSNFFSKERIKNVYGGDVLKACESCPVMYSYFMQGFKLRDYQAYMLLEMLNNRFIQAIWGRRMGKTTVFKLFASWAINYNKFPSGLKKTTNVVVVAHTADGSDDYINDVKEMMVMGDAHVKKMFKGALGDKYFTKRFPKKTDTAKDNSQSFSIYKDGWNTIKSYPPTTRARGKGASVILLDELAFWHETSPDEYKIYNQAVRPIITDNPETSRIYIATTPDGPSGLSYDLMDIDNHRTRYKLYWFPYYYREDQAYLDEIDETRKEYENYGRLEDFKQEYLAELISVGTMFFKKDEYDNVFKDTGLEMSKSSGLTVRFGLDFGGSKNSHTVFTVSYMDEEGVVKRLYSFRYEIGDDSTLKEDLIEWSRLFPYRESVEMDDQGAGSTFYGWARQYFGGELSLVNFRKEKDDMYRQFKIRCFQDKVKSYYDPQLLEEMTSFTRKMTPSKGKTDDSLDSFVLSVRPWMVSREEKSKVGVLIY